MVRSRVRPRLRTIGIVGSLLTALVSIPSPATASNADLPPGFVEKGIAVANAIRAPYGMEISSDGRLWVLEQNRGDLRIVKMTSCWRRRSFTST